VTDAPSGAWRPATLAGDPPADVASFLLRAAWPHRRLIAASLALACLGVATELALIWYGGRLVDLLAATPRAELWSARGPELAAVAVAILLWRPLVAFGREVLDDVLFRPEAVNAIRFDAYRHVLHQPVGWFRHNLSGRIAAQVVETGSTGAGAIYALLHGCAWVILYLLGATLMLGSIDARLMLPLGGWLVLFGLLGAWAVPRFRDASDRFQAARADLSGQVVDSFGNIEAVKLAGLDRADDAETLRQFEATRTTFVELQKVEVAINVGMIALGGVLIVSLTGSAVGLWQSGAAPLGLVAAALALSLRAAASAEWLLDTASFLFGQIGGLRQSLRTVAQPVRLSDAADARPLRLQGGGIEFSDVSHRRGGEGGPDQLTLQIRPGEKLGLVGASGVGKTTLAELLMRFEDPETGTITIDGQDLRSVTQASLRAAIAVVPQDPSLLHRSLRENIALGRPDATQAQIEDAARRAGAHNFVAGLAAGGRTGYDVLVGERGVTLSGGQRQRIALARAILKDAPILVLDEATSALDSETEDAVLQALYGLMEGRTVIAIAHRLSTLARMDRIVVLEAGRIAEAGSHTELLLRGGRYSALWSRQSGGMLDEAPA
jgi:ATP-binding cassette subfamily B multidrug efflux pump